MPTTGSISENGNSMWEQLFTRKILAHIHLHFALLLMLFALPASAQLPFGAPTLQPPPQKKGAHRVEELINQSSQPQSSLPPSLSIAAQPLGFSSPGPIYLGQRSSMASLDFLDENHLLFTFRVPGLLHRDPASDKGHDSDEHHIRAVVLSLPGGAVEAEALWTLHDRSRYLWALKDGHFLLRDGLDIKQGDASLALKPVFHFPGPLDSLDLDPLEQFLVTNSHEPPPVETSSAPAARSTAHGAHSPLKLKAGPQAAPQNAAQQGEKGAQRGESAAQQGGAQNRPLASSQTNPDLTRQSDSQSRPSFGWVNHELHDESSDSDASLSAHAAPTPAPPPPTREVVVRILHRNTGEVMLVSRVHAPVYLPINSTGYVEALQGLGDDWMLNHYAFDTTVSTIRSIDSPCPPFAQFISDHLILVIACTPNGGSRMTALSLDGTKLWGKSLAEPPIRIRTSKSANGLRLARETIVVDPSISPSAPLEWEDVQAQRVSVLDALTGNELLTTIASPVLDAGGNLALSPSGERVAVLRAGQIQIWNLDPALPSARPTPHP